MRLPSWKLPQNKTAKHAISRICSMIFDRTCGAYVSKFFEYATLNQELQYANRLHFGDFLRQSLGAPLLILIFSGSSHFKELNKCNFTCVFLTSSVNFCGASNRDLKQNQHQRLFRKHRILRIKIETLFFGTLFVELRV